MVGSLSTVVLHLFFCHRHLYDYDLLHKFLFYKNLCSFTHFPTCLFQFRVADGQSLSQQLRAQGRKQPQTGCPSHGKVHSHTHTLTLIHTGTCRHISDPIWASLRCGRKLGHQEKTHIDVGRAGRLHTVSGATREVIIFWSSTF